jgi:hypothetical protein
VLYSPILTFAELSFLRFYLNLFPDKFFGIRVYITIFLVIGSHIVIVVSLPADCRPFAKIFDVTIREGQCPNKTALYIATGALNTVTDVMGLVLPIPMVLRLQMVKSR